MAVQRDTAPVAAVIGVACILGSATLAWLSSPATLHLARDNEELATAVIEARLFGVVVHGVERIERIRAISIQRFEDSPTPPRLLFQTPRGPVDLGRNQQLFAPDASEINAFLKADAPASLTLSSIARGSELRRFVFAQVVAACMALAGLGLTWSAVRSLMT